jgi:hypothetical protein
LATIFSAVEDILLPPGFLLFYWEDRHQLINCSSIEGMSVSFSLGAFTFLIVFGFSVVF